MRTTGTELAQQFGQCYHAADRGKPSGDGHPMSYSELPLTRYAMSGDVSVAYQTMGDGPIDMIAIPGAISHVEFLHEMPGYTAFLQRLSRFARVITFDKRGQGLSDRISGAPTLEERMDDVRAVLDSVGAQRAALLGFSEGCAMSAMFAASYPDRVSHLAERLSAMPSFFLSLTHS